MRVFLRTHGCRANQYDTEALRALLAAAGAEETDNPRKADFAVFNSCTVTAAAEADLRSEVRRAGRSNPSLRTIVMGCAAGLTHRDESTAPLATLPGVDAVIPGADIMGVVAALGLRMPLAAPRAEKIRPQTGARALLRIQDGCDEHCTFCATTLARGASRSRDIDSIVTEASSLADFHAEIVITGIHIGSFGRDTGTSLGELMQLLMIHVPRVRFRLTSIEATEVDDRLAELFADDPHRLAPYLHAPLQSGSNAILKRMGRHWYDAEAYAASVSRVTAGRQVFALSADVITGFPGETSSDHQATVELVGRLPFTSLHVFPYSPRPGTAATRIAAAVPATIARERARELRVIAAEKRDAYAARRAGQGCDVVVTSRGEGLTEDYLSVAVSDVSIPRRSRFPGTLRADASGRLTAFPIAAG